MSYRLCLVAILNAKPGEFTSLMGFLCSSWTTVNMGTSGRSVADPLGRDHRYVEEANCMASRFLWPYLFWILRLVGFIALSKHNSLFLRISDP